MQSRYTHIPYTLLWDKAPLDISFAFGDEKPAGKHGFMTVQGDRLVFEDGTQTRFWGTNFNSGANFPEHSHSEKVAKRLACMGVNIVRLHQLDAEWATPNIFQFRKGKRLDNTGGLDAESMDRLDYLICCLKREGIYVYLDLLCYRKFKTGDGVENALELAEAGKPYSNFSRRLIELQKRFAVQIWTHYNPYTKLAYKDEPAIVLCEIINESDLVHNAAITLEPYKSELIALWKQWTGENGLTGESADEPDFASQDENMLAFKCGLMQSYYSEMIAACRDCGVKIPIAGTNWQINMAVLKAQQPTDFTDGHIYSWVGDQRRFADRTVLADRDNMITALAFNRVADKPFFVSEWDEPWPNQYRAASPLYMAALGAFQGFAVWVDELHCGVTYAFEVPA